AERMPTAGKDHFPRLMPYGKRHVFTCISRVPPRQIALRTVLAIYSRHLRLLIGGMLMRKSACLAALLIISCLAPVIGQEGHPLTGTWAGDWGPSNTQRNHITLVMNWDGKNVTGVINPGPDSIPIGSVYLDVTKWTVRIEADAKDQS